jgi:hypothetical protein
MPREAKDDEPKTAFVNIYPPLVGAVGSAYATREMADQMAGQSRIACVEITYWTGEGIR